ncbi:hypothetical protein C8N43_0444 [Litoreibacter ponti]|uniref:DUF6456 domain-containing protein n=1 Tax=Litoreibacter ponti TaxID=1510457 RepID=A0A2T6BIA9_9RHOB|nr:DUF6456 domain-containing protein [Litoreibacter ponti]PTX55798.1 hypothetical protein C8N43_0444 [Litoreibacter ponti]
MHAAPVPTGQMAMPDWVPQAVRRYLIHTEKGRSFRDLAREEGVHASTVLRQVRRFESRRDDPLVDEALEHLSHQFISRPETFDTKGSAPMTAQSRNHSETYSKASPTAGGPTILGDEQALAREARRVLRRLCETGAILALASEMDNAVVLRSLRDGPPTRTAVVSRDVAQAFALKDWIKCTRTGRVASYEITSTGRAALKQYLSEEMARKRRSRGEHDGSCAFGRPDWADSEAIIDDGAVLPLKPNMAESPLAMLARKRGQDGKPFLDPDLVHAGERLREDFELAQMGPRIAQTWDGALAAQERAALIDEEGLGDAPRAARERIFAAVDDLGPGLGDIIMRCCCFLEGLETAEKRMGWSARSGKVVLRIALQRLRRHYVEKTGHVSAMIG